MFLGRFGWIVVIALLYAGSPAKAQNIRYMGDGPWSEAANWVGGAIPGEFDTARINWANNTVTLDYEAPLVNRVQIGVDESGNLVIEDGGVLSAFQDVTAGNNGSVTGTLTVNSGAVVNVGRILWAGRMGSFGTIDVNDGAVINVFSHLWFGPDSTGSCVVNINSGGAIIQTGNVDGILGLGTINAVDPSGGTATLNVNDGGLLALNNIHAAGTSIQPGSMLNIYGSGRVTLPGDFVGVMESYAAAGFISGDDVVGNVAVSYDLGADETTVVVAPPPSPSSSVSEWGLYR